MYNIINLILLISFIGVSFYSVWVIILICGSLRETKINYDFSQIPNDIKMFILMPMLDEAEVAKQTLINFLKNTINLPQVCLYVIDDGSDDGTAAVIAKFITDHQQSNKIHLIRRLCQMHKRARGMR